MPRIKGLYEHNLISQVKLPSINDPFDINDTQALHFLGTTVTNISGGTSAGTTINIGTTESPDNVTVSVNDVVLYGTTKTMYQCSSITTEGSDPGVTTLHWADISPTATDILVTDVKVDGTSILVDTVANLTIASFAAGALANGMEATTQAVTDNTTKIATTAFVKSAISGITNPMIFEGSATLNASGAITVTVPAQAADIKKGFTYKVTTSVYETVKAGDTLIAVKDAPTMTTGWTDADWIVIPSGDEHDGTVSEIRVGAGLTATDDTVAAATSITTTGEIELNLVSDAVHGTATAATVSQVDHIYPVMIDHANNLAVATNKDTIMNTVTDATIANPVVTAVAASTTSATGNVDLFDVTNGVLTLKYLAPTTANNAVFQVTPTTP